MVIKITPEKYLHFGTDMPHPDFYLSGWDWEVGHFLWTIPYVVYTKKLIK